MGVSGSGKSYLASRLAEATGWPFAEGDDYHSEANKTLMAAGIPLTDADRIPWLDTLHTVLLNWQQEHRSGILACSALKATYRDRLWSPGVTFVHLTAGADTIEDRVSRRTDHFMPPSLLASQLATLEPLVGGKHGVIVSVESRTPEEVVDSILALTNL